MPALTHFYGLRPCDWDEMTFDEARQYVSQYEAHLREQSKQRGSR